jgi:murein DD-endopeptidase MepM/ murein hydrolase activator NlpD
MIAPISNFMSRRLNKTLHGRSVYRKQNVSGHNCFKGFTTPGVGDGIDLFGPAGESVYAIEDCTQTRWSNDTTKLEVIYLTGKNWVAVYAHIDATHEGTGMKIMRGEEVGKIRGDLYDPHLHFELWINGRSLSARTSKDLQVMTDKLFVEDIPSIVIVNAARIPYTLVNGSAIIQLRPFANALGLVVNADAYPIIKIGDRVITYTAIENSAYVKVRAFAEGFGFHIDVNDYPIIKIHN